MSTGEAGREPIEEEAETAESAKPLLYRARAALTFAHRNHLPAHLAQTDLDRLILIAESVYGRSFPISGTDPK